MGTIGRAGLGVKDDRDVHARSRGGVGANEHLRASRNGEPFSSIISSNKKIKHIHTCSTTEPFSPADHDRSHEPEASRREAMNLERLVVKRVSPNMRMRREFITICWRRMVARLRGSVVTKRRTGPKASKRVKMEWTWRAQPFMQYRPSWWWYESNSSGGQSA